jgi:hypothetical protein
MFFDLVRVSPLKIQYNMSSTLFTTLQIKDIKFKTNCHCTYVPVFSRGWFYDWHLVHLKPRYWRRRFDYSNNGSFARRTYLARRPRSMQQIENCNKLAIHQQSNAVQVYNLHMVAKQVFRLLNGNKKLDVTQGWQTVAPSVKRRTKKTQQ